MPVQLVNCLPGGELISIRPSYARFPAQPFCLKFQIPVQYGAPGLVQQAFDRKALFVEKPLCGVCAPHQSLSLGGKAQCLGKEDCYRVIYN
jgi:hypothetical protein